MKKRAHYARILNEKKMSKKAAAATQMFHGYNIENQRHGINKDYLPNNTLSFFGNYRDDKSALSFTQSQCLKIAKKFTFVVYESITLETLGDTFLPLENSFEFLVILFTL